MRIVARRHMVRPGKDQTIRSLEELAGVRFARAGTEQLLANGVFGLGAGPGTRRQGHGGHADGRERGWQVACRRCERGIGIVRRWRSHAVGAAGLGHGGGFGRLRGVTAGASGRAGTREEGKRAGGIRGSEDEVAGGGGARERWGERGPGGSTGGGEGATNDAEGDASVRRVNRCLEEGSGGVSADDRERGRVRVGRAEVVGHDEGELRGALEGSCPAHL
jgi:hypothetical protein